MAHSSREVGGTVAAALRDWNVVLPVTAFDPLISLSVLEV